MPTLGGPIRDAAFRIAAQAPTQVRRPHRVGHLSGDAASAAAGPASFGNLLIAGAH